MGISGDWTNINQPDLLVLLQKHPITLYEWPFQEPKLQVPIGSASVRPKFQGISLEKMTKHMVQSGTSILGSWNGGSARTLHGGSNPSARSLSGPIPLRNGTAMGLETLVAVAKSESPVENAGNRKFLHPKFLEWIRVWRIQLVIDMSSSLYHP